MVTRRAILLALVALAHTWLAPRAGANPMYTVTALGPLPGNNHSIAWDINSRGQVVGLSWTTDGNVTRDAGSFLYGGGQIAPITVSDARKINDTGQIIGNPGGGAGDINNAGQVARGGTLTMGTTATPLGDLGTPGSTVANGINSLGQVVGMSETTGGAEHAFLFSSGHMTDLGTLGGFGSSSANAINDSGQVVGDGGPFTQHSHAFLSTGGRISDLGTLGGVDSSAKDINNRGQVVGSASTSDGTFHAFLYMNGSMLDLNDLIPPTTGWVLTGATAINDSGQIAGTGTRDGVDFQGFLLTPMNAPEPATLAAIAALCAGCGLRSWRRNKRGAATTIYAAVPLGNNAARLDENADQAP